MTREAEVARLKPTVQSSLADSDTQEGEGGQNSPVSPTAARPASRGGDFENGVNWNC